jgi:tRNA 2-thiouridine synthesizing protein A
MAIVTTIDARGLACPLPLALAKRRMTELRAGETLLVLATDPEAPIDLAAWAVEEGHAYAERDSGEGWCELRVCKGPAVDERR